MASAINEGLIDIDKDHFYDAGSVKVDNSKLRCWKSGGHGNQTFRQVLENSCKQRFNIRTHLCVFLFKK